MLTETLVVELDPSFEILPVIRRMGLPILEQEVGAALRAVPERLPETFEELVALVRELPAILRELRQRSGGSPGAAAPS